MPTKQLLAFITVCLLLAGCRPGGCEACLRNETCTNGKCYPIEEGTICGEHRHSYADSCVCDGGWVGADCSVPVSKFVGTYHVVGDWYSHLYVDPWTTNSGHIDTVMEVTLRHDTLYAKNWPYTFGLGNYDTSKYYRFGWLFGNYDYGYLYFHKVPDDTLIYTTYFGGMGGGTTTNLVGVKLQ